MFYILYLEINKVVSVKILCKNMDGIIFFFYQGSGIKILGKMGLRDQNNGKKIGTNGSRIHHVTTLLLGTSSDKSLLYTVYFYNGKIFGLMLRSTRELSRIAIFTL